MTKEDLKTIVVDVDDILLESKMEEEPNQSMQDELRGQKKTDYLALIAVTFIKFGDSVETFLPGVISQPISCELNITKSQEDILSLAIYIALTIGNILVTKVTNTFGRRATILPGLYITILVTVLSAVVPNYITLLISRVLLGLMIGFKYGPSSVYMAEICSTPKFYRFSVLITSTFYTLGGLWCGLLGYLFLDFVGWRYFFLISSLPVFLPPLLLL